MFGRNGYNGFKLVRLSLSAKVKQIMLVIIIIITLLLLHRCFMIMLLLNIIFSPKIA